MTYSRGLFHSAGNKSTGKKWIVKTSESFFALNYSSEGAKCPFPLVAARDDDEIDCLFGELTDLRQPLVEIPKG
jgi:hypothetical protein